MRLETFGPIATGDLVQTAAEAVARASDPRLLIVYVPHAEVTPELARDLAAAVPVPVVGATPGGPAYTERGMTTEGAVGGVLTGAELSVNVTTIANASHGSSVGPRIAAMGIAERASVLVLASTFGADHAALAEVVRDNVPRSARIFGGAAGDSLRLEGARVLSGGTVWEDALCLVGLENRFPMRVDLMHGWHASPKGRDLRVSEADGNRLVALEGRPAVTVFREELVRLRHLGPDEPLEMGITLLCRLGVSIPFGEGWSVRAPLRLDDDGAMLLAGAVPTDALVRVVATGPDQLLNAVEILSERCHQRLGRAPKGALLFECAGRPAVLGDRHGDHRQAVDRHTAGFPRLGLSCYGEFARATAHPGAFHNGSCVIAAW